MRAYAFVFSFLGLCCSAVSGELVSGQLEQALKAFQPMAIELSDTATVVVPQARVSEEQYQAMAGEFCYLQWSGAADLAGLDSFAVLNEYRRQGWVLEDPAKSCVEFGEVAGDAALTTLLSFTHMY